MRRSIVKRFLILSCLIVPAIFSQAAFAANWVGGSGGDLWNVAANWSTGIVPTAVDTVYIYAPPYQGPIIDSTVSAVGKQIDGPGNSVGENLMQMTGGTLTLTNNWRVNTAYGQGPGKVKISGGTITTGGYLFVGYRGTGVLTMTDGVLNIGADIDTGRDRQSETVCGDGTLNLEGGTITVGTKMRVGNHGKAVLNMSGGSLTVSQYLRIGDVNTGIGVANISGGTLTVNASVGEGLRVGNSGTGTLNITGGTINVGGDAIIGNAAGSHGQVIMNNGVVNATTYLTVGNQGNGSFIMNGGTVNLVQYLQVGGVGTPQGTGYFELNGGTILLGRPDTVDLLINDNSTMNIAGGTMIIRGNAVSYVEALILGNRLVGYNGDGWINLEYVEQEAQTIVTGIPEPATIALLTLGGLVLLRKKSA